MNYLQEEIAYISVPWNTARNLSSSPLLRPLESYHPDIQNITTYAYSHCLANVF